MVTLTLSDKQVIELVKQLEPDAKRAVLEALMDERDLWWDMTLAQGEERLRQLASQRGLEWNKMSEVEREEFVDTLLHEKP
jgi:glycerophosphoryl diester phosphodiesterase